MRNTTLSQWNFSGSRTRRDLHRGPLVAIVPLTLEAAVCPTTLYDATFLRRRRAARPAAPIASRATEEGSGTCAGCPGMV